MDKDIEELKRETLKMLAKFPDDSYVHLVDKFLRKAPKNELLPIKYSELIKLMIEKGSPKIGESRVKLARNIIAKFGSSGKRPLNEEGVAKKLYEMHNYSRTFESNEPKWDELSEDNKNNSGFRWQAKEICKEFSTAEVSEERIAEIIAKSHYRENILSYDIDAAKAIKRELDGK